jgi:hypothetical protein
MRILLSEGSGLTSRQAATCLGRLGHHVEILSSSPICLTRFTRHVRRVHSVPNFGREPLAWFNACCVVVKAQAIDFLFPTQEQVTVLSACQGALPCATVVPPFSSLRRVQDKISAYRTLQEFGVPQPETVIVESRDDLLRIDTFPAFVKRPISTASSGVRRTSSRSELDEVSKVMGVGEYELLVQTQADGPLAMVQAIADNGRLVAHHANLRVLEGVGGGASLKESVVLPGLYELLRKLVAALNWHGALSMDVIATTDGPVVIDVNPRLVEPMNAFFAGVDLVGAMLDLARHQTPDEQSVGRAGIRSRQLLLAILGAAQNKGSRTAILRELAHTVGRRGEYEDAAEELTPISGDPLASVPVIAATIATVLSPTLWRAFHAGAVGPYALTSEGWNAILSLVECGGAGSRSETNSLAQ